MCRQDKFSEEEEERSERRRKGWTLIERVSESVGRRMLVFVRIFLIQYIAWTYSLLLCLSQVFPSTSRVLFVKNSSFPKSMPI